MLIILDDKIYVVNKDTFMALWGEEPQKKGTQRLAAWVRANGVELEVLHLDMDGFLP